MFLHNRKLLSIGAPLVTAMFRYQTLCEAEVCTRLYQHKTFSVDKSTISALMFCMIHIVYFGKTVLKHIGDD